MTDPHTGTLVRRHAARSWQPGRRDAGGEVLAIGPPARHNLQTARHGSAWLTTMLLAVSLLTGCASSPIDGGGLALGNPFGSFKKPSGAGAPDDTKAESDTTFARQMVKAHTSEQAGKYDEARVIYQHLIASYPDRYEPYHRLGVVADRQRKYREAQALYTQAIRLNPKDPDLFNDLGYCLYLQGKLGKAESALWKAIGLQPANPRYRNNLGMVLGHLGRHEEALDQFCHAGSDADAYYNLAFILASRDNVGGAKNCFRLALAVDPTHSKAREALRSFDQYESDPEALADSAPVADERIRWIPYSEDHHDPAGTAAQAASHTAPVNADRRPPATKPSDTQALLRRARLLMSERMARIESQPGAPPGPAQ